MSTATIIIGADGKVRTIYSDDTAELMQSIGGEVSITRASHVEPVGNAWSADMSPVGGPVLGPFATRAAALEAEHAWLLKHDIPEVTS